MWILLGIVILYFGIAIIVKIFLRSRVTKLRDQKFTPPAKHSPTYAVVSKEESQAAHYPFVYVNDDETVRELHPDEREYLETPFDPVDSGRPSIKRSFESENGWGKRGGFCPRCKVPGLISIQEAPLENPSKPLTKEGLTEFLRGKGLVVTENADGTIISRKLPKV